MNFRKICRNCKCGQEEHDVLTSNEEDRKVGKLFEDTKYTTLIAKLKNDGIPMYKRNVMILTNPVPAKKNISINTVTYEWAPPVQNQTLVSQTLFFLHIQGKSWWDIKRGLVEQQICLLLVFWMYINFSSFLSSKTKIMVDVFSESCLCSLAEIYVFLWNFLRIEEMSLTFCFNSR